jgi:hypothetical protein
MSSLSQKPTTVREAAERFRFILENSNTSTTCGNYSIFKGLNDFINKYGCYRLDDLNRLKVALDEFFNVKGNTNLHNVRVYFIRNFFSWMEDKSYIPEDISRNYISVS